MEREYNMKIAEPLHFYPLDIDMETALFYIWVMKNEDRGGDEFGSRFLWLCIFFSFFFRSDFGSYLYSKLG